MHSVTIVTTFSIGKLLVVKSSRKGNSLRYRVLQFNDSLFFSIILKGKSKIFSPIFLLRHTFQIFYKISRKVRTKNKLTSDRMRNWTYNPIRHTGGKKGGIYKIQGKLIRRALFSEKRASAPRLHAARRPIAGN